MSSFSSLFGSASVDKNIDTLFNSGAGPVTRNELKARTVIDIPERETEEGDESQENNDEESDDIEEDKEEVEEEITVKKQKKQKKKDANDDLESKYFDKLLKEEEKEAEKKAAKTSTDSKTDEANEDDNEAEDSGSDSDSDSDSDAETGSKRSKAAKTVDLKEDELEKAERTVFVGNVTSAAISSKTIYKRFKKVFGQYGKISSIRFRSISFDESLPRKVAFAKKHLHKSRDTVNAYVVYKEREPSKKVLALNATVFENFHLRIDHVAHPAPKDNRRTIFVGNLDFEEKEETLWKYFNANSENDVESVRVIRDAKTNLGKGFALVQFKDTLSVNKALLLNDKPLPSGDGKKKGRKLRISRAKSHAKPSLLSPNHFDNTKKAYASNRSKSNLSDNQKTKLGRASTILGKADRATAGKQIVEGQRAKKGSSIAGIKGLKGAKVKKPRIRDRSTKFKKERDSMSREAKK